MYECVSVCGRVCVFPTLPQDEAEGHIFKQGLTALNSDISFS